MSKIKRLFIETIICLSLTGIALCYRNEIGEGFVYSYQRILPGHSKPAADNDSNSIKMRANLQLQQQAQLILNPAPVNNETSDNEKLEILNDALHELESAEDEYDREIAVMTLGDYTDVAAKQGMITALHDTSKLVTTQAVRQINHWQNPADRTELLLLALENMDDEIVEQTLRTITMVEDKRLIARIKQLRKHRNPDIRDAAQLALNLAP
ncbi:hypothetical protein [Methylomonas albis]|uniref:HEAT repeat domain-containing protein n=1 Tax=Methylomonas albis TaxID=1854563 RepID=A0ABR9D2N1_9GAMM|nr:hypothetical protein [Methylomonas albis]MBD9356528.1 hypothetical protein [Methylomonas albis]CAD6879644.1 hypothetical protein [Methylomonas albis]